MNADEVFESIASELTSDPGVAKARMFGSTGLKVAGKVFAMVVRGRLVVKLPRAKVEGLVASGKGDYFDPGHGRLMKEWVGLKPGTESQWRSLAEEAKEFVATSR